MGMEGRGWIEISSKRVNKFYRLIQFGEEKRKIDFESQQ